MTTEHEVQIGNVEKELNRLWNEKLSTGQIKACLFNLVIYAHEERRAAYLREIAHDILERFPCRIIFVKGDKKTDSAHLNVTVTNEIIGKGNKKITCDEINIDAGYQKLSRVPFLVIPHLVPDLPIYLLWGQDPTSDEEILPHLENHASRLIFDSECTNDLQHFSHDMRVLLDASKAAVMDVNWAQISGWRDTIAKVFDTEACLNRLKNAKKITIAYNKKPTEYVRNHETKAIYLQAWLASSLGWQFADMSHDGERRHITYNGVNHEVKIEFIPGEEPDLLPGAILGFDVEGEQYEYCIDRKQSLPKVNVRVTTEDRCELPCTLSLPDLKKRSVFMREIFYSSVNEHYKRMLEFIGSTKWEMK